jgi:putative transposase
LNPNKRKLAKLCLILDDHSRFVVHGQFYWDEKMPSLEDSLKKAIEKRGIPDQCYSDNGAAFSAGHIAHICARLGIRLSHTRPYKPQGKGKSERMFGFVDTSFLPIAMNKISKNLICTLEDLNLELQDWLEEHYHARKHGETGESPRIRMARHPVRQLPYSKQELRRLFFLEETRKVDKTGMVSLDGLTYQVPAELCGLKVQSDPVSRYRKRFRKENPEDAKSESVLDGQLVFSFSGETAAGGRNRETLSAMEVRG